MTNIGNVISNNGIVMTNNGDVINNNGIVTLDNGDVMTDIGIVINNNGIVMTDGGNVINNIGIVNVDGGRFNVQDAKMIIQCGVLIINLANSMMNSANRSSICRVDPCERQFVHRRGRNRQEKR